MMYIRFFPYPFVVGLLIIALSAFLLRKRGWVYLVGLTLFGLYTMAVFYAMFFPIPVPEGWPATLKWDEVSRNLGNSLNLIPFNFGRLFSDAVLGRISSRMVFWQTGGNILITIPFGVGIGFLTKLHSWRVILIALGFGLTFEGLQLFFLLLGVGYPHIIDINDLLLNALGVLLGYGLYNMAIVGLRKAKSIRPKINNMENHSIQSSRKSIHQ